MKRQFTHLHVHSHYSLLDGLAKIPELVQRAKDLGMSALALTDHGVMYGVVEFYKECKKQGVKPIIGEEFYVTPGSREQKRARVDDVRYHLTLLASTNAGYTNLVKLTTKAHLEGFYYKPRIDKELMREHSEGLICLSGCMTGELARTIRGGDMDKARAVVREHQEIYGKDSYYIEVWDHPNVPDSSETKEKLIALARELDVPLVATHDVHYLDPEDKEAQDILVAVQTGATIGEENRMSMKAEEFHLVSPEEMAERFEDVPEAIENAVAIAKRCNVELTLGEIQLPHFEVPEGETPESYLKHLCREGLDWRYEKVTSEIKKRLEYELGVISNMGFATYMLIVADFVNWAKKQNIVVGPGRGSVAGSLVAYSLGITNIDPIKYNLLFERFLNPDRVAMPDIDLDFADARRDEVIEYVRDQYGDDHVAQIITFGTLAARAAIRDTGRALGLSYSFCDMVAKLIPFNMGLAKALKRVDELAQLYRTNEDAKKLLDEAQRLEGVARHASTHACGVVITKNPLTETVPLQHGTRGEDTIVTQYEMHTIEDLGLLKMDFLGLRNLTIIEDTIRAVKKNKNTTIDIEDIPLDDPKAYRLLQQGQTTGVFQLESGGMKRYLKDLSPTEFEDIVAMVSLYRPGPLETGMTQEFINRKHGKKKVSYLHPKLEPILKNTYGIMVYQEQLMQVARDLGGFTLAEADILRKAVGKKIKKLLDEQKERVISGMVENGVAQKVAERIWELMEPFARYGFNRSHAACYALIAYQTAYLKAHYTDEFMAALLNAESSDVERIAFLTKEAKEVGIEVLPPDINESDVDFATAGDDTIRFGLGAIKNVGTSLTRNIVAEREENGPFLSIEDFVVRVHSRDLNKKSCESLVKAGVFDSLEDRATMYENLDNVLSFAKEFKKTKDACQTTLFDAGETNAPPLSLQPATKELSNRKKLTWEKELLGLYISDHPLSAVRDILQKQTREIQKLQTSSRRVKIGGIITKTKKIVTKNGKPMAFAEIEDLSGKIEVVVFPSVFEKDNAVWQEEEMVVLDGKVQKRDNELKFICDRVRPLQAA